MVGLWHNIGIEFQPAGDRPGALEEYGKAQRWADELGSRRHQVEVKLSLGILLTKRGDEEDALALLSKAIDAARQHNLNKQLAHALSSLADLYLQLGDANAAQPCIGEAETLAKVLEADDLLPEIQRMWAIFYLSQQQPARSITARRRVGGEGPPSELDLEEGITFRVLGRAAREANRQSAEALNAFEQSFAILATRDPYEAARTLREVGTRSDKRWTASPSAIDHLRKAITLFRASRCRECHRGHGTAVEGVVESNKTA